MKIPHFVFLLGLILSGCSQSDKTAEENHQTGQCATKSVRSLKGQIQYFDGMTLLIPGCKIYNNSAFDFDTELLLNKVIAQINLEKRLEFHYVDIEFKGYTNWTGKLIIKDIEVVEPASSILFETNSAH